MRMKAKPSRPWPCLASSPWHHHGHAHPAQVKHHGTTPKSQPYQPMTLPTSGSRTFRSTHLNHRHSPLPPPPALQRTSCAPAAMQNANGHHADDGASHTVADIFAANPNASLPRLCELLHARVSTFLATTPSSDDLVQLQQHIRVALAVIKEALNTYTCAAPLAPRPASPANQRHSTRSSHLSLSYNGGKDCLVLLILYLCALHTHYEQLPASAFPQTLESVYTQVPKSFPAVEAFVAQTALQYRLALARSTLPMKAAFAAYLAEAPHVRAIFVGTRRTDPYGAALTHFAATDSGWPAFMRVHPVIDWRYRDIWTFIRYFGVPYCELYDLGYTSLGSTTDTFPNPALKVPSAGAGDGDAGEVAYRPAYELLDDSEERLGRPR